MIVFLLPTPITCQVNSGIETPQLTVDEKEILRAHSFHLCEWTTMNEREEGNEVERSTTQLRSGIWATLVVIAAALSNLLCTTRST